MQQRSNKDAPQEKKKYCGSQKKYLGGIFSYFMDDEKYVLSRY
jgi:hypothetical protein